MSEVDLVQGFVMVLGVLLLLGVAFALLGGLGSSGVRPLTGDPDEPPEDAEDDDFDYGYDEDSEY